MSSKNAHVLVWCGFNRGYIEQACSESTFGNAQEHCFSKVVNIHTREDKTLDLLLTNSPSPINRVKWMPPIGKAYYDIVYVEYDIKAKRMQQARKRFTSTNELTRMVFVAT